MKNTPQHSKAITSLYSHSRFSPEDLRAMPVETLKQILAADGVDIGKAELKLSAIKETISNANLFNEACKNTLSQGDTESAIDLSNLTSDEIKSKLLEKYKRLEDIPLAARGFKELGRVELESLYRDLILKGKKRA